MKILVLDTIHGGQEIARHFNFPDCHVDMVDIYRGNDGISVEEALNRRYDLVAAPVHLDPSHPLLHMQNTRVITHHEAVRMILGDNVPRPMIEITGARGKTTTAYALAHLMKGAGVLHTSGGTWQYPEKKLLWKKSITPASVINAAARAYDLKGWLIGEESIGVSGAGDIGVLTSGDDYPVASGKKSAVSEKTRLLSACNTVVVAPGADITHDNAIYVEDVTEWSGNTCTCRLNGVCRSFSNPLLELIGYRAPLMTAATVALLLGTDPSPLENFKALKGRMSTGWANGALTVDNSNSGTNRSTTIEAARYARALAGCDDLTLVIGVEAENICEGFPFDEVRDAIRIIRPTCTILVGKPLEGETKNVGAGIPIHYAEDLNAGRELAKSSACTGSIVLSVKTWR